MEDKKIDSLCNFHNFWKTKQTVNTIFLFIENASYYERHLNFHFILANKTDIHFNIFRLQNEFGKGFNRTKNTWSLCLRLVF